MKRGLQLLSLACLCSSLIATAAAQEGQTAAESAKERHLAGHSRFGEAFDEGPRERPAKMTGIGVTHFPITTSHPEAQMWFDQGHTLIHSFWYYEAERAFRWAAKLDPEAPMPYWGLVRATGGARARAFMKEASARKAKASPRERAYIEAWELQFADGAQTTEGRRKFTKALESIVMKFPDDIEAKALLGQEMMGSTRVGTEFLMQQVLAKDPKHPGAHHYRIHNWDDEDGALALDSCRDLRRHRARGSATRCTCPATSTPASGCSTSRRSRSTRRRAPKSATWAARWCSRTTPGTTRTTATI